jgi:hypothetical protein
VDLATAPYNGKEGATLQEGLLSSFNALRT